MHTCSQHPPKQLEPHRWVRVWGCVRISNIYSPLLPVSWARLSVALDIRGAVAGIWVSSSRGRGDSGAWRWGVSWAGLVP